MVALLDEPDVARFVAGPVTTSVGIVVGVEV
jgi:hypothetical protein